MFVLSSLKEKIPLKQSAFGLKKKEESHPIFVQVPISNVLKYFQNYKAKTVFIESFTNVSLNLHWGSIQL